MMIEIVQMKKIIPRVRRSKNNDAFHKEIPRLEGRPYYKKNKNAQIEYVRMVKRLNDQEVKKQKWEKFIEC